MQQIYQVLQSVRPEFDFSASDDYLADGMLDSLDVITIVSELDQRFSISIDGAQIVPESFQNAEAIRDLLARHGIQV